MLLVVGLPLVVIRAYLGVQGVPIPLGDTIWFYPAAYVFARTGNLDTFGGPLTWHGWLYPMLLGAIERVLDLGFSGVLLAEVLVMLAVLLLAIYVLRTSFEAPIILKAASVLTLVGALWASSGRPELLTHALLIFIALIALKLTPPHVYVANGIALGVLAITQPTVALLAALLVFAHYTVRLPPARCLVATAISGILAAGAMTLATVLIYPYGLQGWLKGLAAQAGLTVGRGDTGQIFYYYLFHPAQPLVGGWFVIFAFLLIYLVAANLLRPNARVLFYVAILMIAGASWFLGLRIPPTHYNIIAFVPLITLFIAAHYLRISRRNVRYALYCATLGLSVALGLGAWRTALVGVLSLEAGVLPSEAAQAVRAYLKTGDTVGIPASLVFADLELLKDSRLRISAYDRRHGESAYVFVVQAASSRSRPPELEGYALVEDRFKHNAIIFNGVRIANTPLTYEFAAYRKLGRGDVLR